MDEKSKIRTAFDESKKRVGDAAARARHAVDTPIKAVRDAAEKFRTQIGGSHSPRVDRAARTVQGEHCIYVIDETSRGQALDGRYVVRRRVGDGATESIDAIGAFDVKGSTITIHCGDKIPPSEVVFVAAAWLEQPSAPSSASS